MNDEKKPFSDTRWHEPIKMKTVGDKPILPEEKEQIEKETEEMLRFYGALKPDEEYHPEDLQIKPQKQNS